MINLLLYGSFDGQIDPEYWTGGTINRTLGFPRLGCALLAAGESLAYDEVSLADDQPYTLYWFYRLGSGATLTVTVGTAVAVHSGAPESVWREGSLLVATEGGAVTPTFAATGGAVYLDSLALVQGALPITRANVASAVAARLSALVADAGLTSTPSASGPEGDYTAAVDEALRAVSAVDIYGDPDVTRLDYSQVNAVIEGVQTSVLQRLRSTYALKVDVSLGPRRENYSQIATSIDAMLQGSSADRRVNTGTLRREGGWRR